MILEKEELEKTIVVFGAGIIARAAVTVLIEESRNHAFNFVGCAVTHTKGNVKEIEGMKIYSLDEVIEKFNNLFFVIAVREQFVPDVQETLEQKGISSYKTISLGECIRAIEEKWKKVSGERGKYFVENINREYLSDEEYLMFLSKQLKEDTLSFEVNLADHCNLNCQCCNHFSPLAEEHFLDFEYYKRDLLRLKELFNNRIGRIMLLGGEPLLNNDIIAIMKYTREVLQNAGIYIVTNGLLFPKMNVDFWITCRECEIGIKVTQYPLKFDYEKWFRYAENQGVEMMDESPEPIKTTYRLPLIESGGLNAYKNYAKCYHANQCIVLREGRLYTCPIAAGVGWLNKAYDRKFPELEQNSINIYKVDDANTILDFLKSPIKMCECCDIYNYEYNIPWKTSSRKCDEWIGELK